mgnify:CR=1 FL=1
MRGGIVQWMGRPDHAAFGVNRPHADRIEPKAIERAPTARTGLKRAALAMMIVAAGLSGVAQAKQKHTAPAGAEPAPAVDKCGHPIVLDNVGSPYTDPVCTALSDKLQPPLYIPEPVCNQGVEPYDSHCFFERLFTVMTASPGPPPLARPAVPYPVK